eukprot:187667_1
MTNNANVTSKRYGLQSFLSIIFIAWVVMTLLITSALLIQDNTHVSPSALVTNNVNEMRHDSATPGLPALVVIGPPKSGTTSLVHTFASRLDNFLLKPGDNGEHHFWNGANGYCCLPDYTNQSWLSFIDAWRTNQIELTSLNHSIWTSTNHPRTCTPNKYQSIYQWTMCHQYSNATDILCKVPYHHHKEMFCRKRKHIDETLKYCHFIESSPTYIRNPLVGVMYAMNMPSVKLLGIIRNPVNMWWSYSWHYFSHLVSKTRDGVSKMEQWIFNSKLNARPQIWPAFKQLTGGCASINSKSKGMDYKHKFARFYREYMALYLKLKLVDKHIEPKVRREPDAMLYSALIFPTLLFWIEAYDEVYGRNIENEWNNLRFVQFEWLYSNQKESFNMIHCWITYGVYECPFTTDNTFENVLRKEHKSYGNYSDVWKGKVQSMYVDCNHAMQSVLLVERPNLLIGSWLDWKY